MRKICEYVALGGTALALLGVQSSALAINIDQILAPGDVDAGQLSGIVDMSLSGNTLTIQLKNTSGDAAGSGAGVLLTGIGFALPDGVTISGGKVVMGASAPVGFTKPADGDVSSEWGWDDGGLKSGALQHTTQPVNTSVSSMESQTTAQFAPGSLVNPPNLDGPDMGLVSTSELDGLGNGVEAIKDSVTITLNLVGELPNGLLDQIENGWVALTFGSPDSGTTVPDASSTLMLFGLAMMGIAGIRRKIGKA
jgi:hypothetical protein